MADFVKVTTVSCPGLFDGTPNFAKVTVSPTLLARIKRLAALAKSKNLYRVELFDYTAKYFKDEECTEPWMDGNICQLECPTLSVDECSFWWEAVVKHTDVTIRTETIYLKEVTGE